MARRKWIATIGALVILWMGGYACLSRDPDATAYRELCVQSAQSALDGLSTARLSTDRGLLDTYQTSLSHDARQLIGQARTQLAGQVPPDGRSARRRDDLMPLLDQAERIYADLDKGRGDGDEQAVRDAAARSAATEEQLRRFIDGNR
jgi:hypothetical protein